MPDPAEPTERFGPILSLWAPATALRDEIRAWLPEYLAAFERQEGMQVGKTVRPRSFQVRHSAFYRAEEQVPAVVVWIAGVTDYTIDPDLLVSGTVQLGVMLVASASHTDATGEVLQRYAASVKALLFDRRTVGGHASDIDLVDEDYEGLNPERRDRTLLSAELHYEATGVVLGRRSSGPPPDADPRPDPRPPWPPAPTAETVDVALDPQPFFDPDV